MEEGRGSWKPSKELVLEHDDEEQEAAAEAYQPLNKPDDSASETYDWRAPAIILGFECFESLGFCGMVANLVVYLGSILHESNANIAILVTTWSGTSYFTPFLGAIVADSYCGGYWMILLSSMLDLTGMVLVTLSTRLHSIKDNQNLIFFSGLYLIAFGSGGIKSSLLPLGADQFSHSNLEDIQRKASFFNWFYFCMNVGALISSTFIVYIQENVDWTLGFGISTAFMVLAVGAFLAGSKTYRLCKPKGSPIKRIIQVLVASLSKIKSRLPDSNSDLYDPCVEGVQRLDRTDDFRFLEKAAVVSADDSDLGSWRLCTLSQVEEVKTFLRLFPIWVTGILYSVSYAQLNSTFVEQGKMMDTTVGSFLVPPASLYAFEVLSVMAWVILYDLVISMIARKILDNGCGLTTLQRMGVGHVLMILTMVTSATVESNRLKSVRRGGRLLKIAWQLPQYFLIAGSEVFSYIAQLEFFYDQGPNRMRSLCTAFSLLTISVGNYMNSLLVLLLNMFSTDGGWIPDNLNEGHLDYFFWVLVGLSSVNFIAYSWCARNYRLKKPIRNHDVVDGM